MTLKVSRSGVFKTVTQMRVRRSGVWKIIEKVWIYKTINGVAAWRIFFVKAGDPPTPPPPVPPVPVPPTPPPVTLSVTISPSPTNGSALKYSGAFPITVATPIITATPTGGTGPYTYQWLLMSWTGTPAPDITLPTAAGTQFRKSMPDYGTQTATFKCKVTDSLGNKGDASVNVTFRVTEPIDLGLGVGGPNP